MIRCKSYEPFCEVEPETFQGDMECSWFAPGIFEGVRLACTKKRCRYFRELYT